MEWDRKVNGIMDIWEKWAVGNLSFENLATPLVIVGHLCLAKTRPSFTVEYLLYYIVFVTACI